MWRGARSWYTTRAYTQKNWEVGKETWGLEKQASTFTPVSRKNRKKHYMNPSVFCIKI